MQGKEFARTIAALSDVFDYLDLFLVEYHIDDSVAFAVKLTVEELFTNLVRHSVGGSERVLLDLNANDQEITILLTDFDVEPFDPDSISAVDTAAPIEERSPGGLGLHLVRSVVDKLTFEYDQRTLRITAIKKLRGNHV